MALKLFIDILSEITEVIYVSLEGCTIEHGQRPYNTGVGRDNACIL